MTTLRSPLLALAALAVASTATAGSMADFGRCLTRNGAVFYGASWCPHCRNQRVTLGDAMSQVRYVECADQADPEESTSACRNAGVHSYPTWTFGDGSRASGELSLERLAAKTGCELPAGGGGPHGGVSPHGGAPAPLAPPVSHGAKVIEVPD